MTDKATTALTQKLEADLQATDEVIANDYAADGVTVVGTVRVPVGDLLRKGAELGRIRILDANTTRAAFTSAPAYTIWIARGSGFGDLLTEDEALANPQMVINLSGSTLIIASTATIPEQDTIRIWGSAVVTYDGSTVTCTETLIPLDSVSGLIAALNAKLGATAQAADVDPAGAAISAALAGKATTAQGALADSALQPGELDGQVRYPLLQVNKRMASLRIEEVDAMKNDLFTDNRLDVTGITQANPPLVTTGTYGTADFQNGDYVIFEGITGMTQINGLVGVVQNKSSASDSTFEVSGIDASAFSAFSNGGTVRRLNNQRMLILNTGDSFNMGKSSEMLGLGFAHQFSRRTIPRNQATGPKPDRDGSLIASYMDYAYSAGVTHYVKNDGGTNGRVATPDYTISLSGAYWSVPSGESVDFYEFGGGLCNASRVDIFYISDSGLGTFKVQTSTTSISSGFSDVLTGIDSDGAKALQRATIRLDSVDDIAVRVEATSGTVKILGCLIYRDDRPEVILVNHAVESLAPSLSYGALSSGVAHGYLTELQADLWTFCFADDGSEQPDALDGLRSWLDSASILDTRHPSILVIGPNPSTLVTSQSTVAAAIKAKCLEHNFAFFDTYYVLGALTANLEKYGLSLDNAHLSEEGSLVIAHEIAMAFGFPSILSGPLSPHYLSGGDVFEIVRSGERRVWVDDLGAELLAISETGVSGDSLSSLIYGLRPWQFPGGYQFDGVSGSCVDLGNIFDQDMTTDWSMDFWTIMKKPSATKVLIGNRSGTPSIAVSVANNGAISLQINDGTNSATAASATNFFSSTSTPRLVHVAAVCDVSEPDGLRLYLNGSLVSSADPTSVGDLTHVNSLLLAAKRSDVGNAECVLASVNLWSKALTSDAIIELMRFGPHYAVYRLGGPVSAGLYAGYVLRDFGGGATAGDWSGNGRDGSVLGGVSLYQP